MYQITVFKTEISLNWTLNNVFPQYYEKFSCQKLKKSYSREPIKDSNRIDYNYFPSDSTDLWNFKTIFNFIDILAVRTSTPKLDDG